MKKKYLLPVLLLVLVAAVAVGGVLLARPAAEPSAPADSEAQPTLAPDFTAYTADGQAVKLSDYVGKPVVLNFWASWCGPCKSEMPEFDSKCAELEGQVQFLMVNLTDGQTETLETARGFVESSGYTFPVLYDLDQAAAMSYGIQAIPTTFFIDAEGYFVAYAQGAIDAATLQQGIDMILE